MTDAGRELRLPGAPIIHDTIDNETIVINQKTGAYYSLEGPAARVWQMLAGGTTTDRLVDELLGAFEVDRARVESEVAGFVGELLDEGLAVAGDADGTQPAQPLDRPTGERLPFSGLALHRYTDLEVLLLVDPIHEVDDTGWPKPLEAAEK